MNNEIKEILAYFEEYIKIIDMHDSEPMLNWKDLKIVLDYITNLQQRIDKAIEYIKHDLLQEQVEYYKNNKYNVTISGTDIMAYEIVDLLDILEGKDNE